MYHRAASEVIAGSRSHFPIDLLYKIRDVYSEKKPTKCLVKRQFRWIPLQFHGEFLQTPSSQVPVEDSSSHCVLIFT